MQTRRNFFQMVVETRAAAAFNQNGLERILAASKNANPRSAEELASDEDFWFDIHEAFAQTSNHRDRNRARRVQGNSCGSEYLYDRAMEKVIQNGI